MASAFISYAHDDQEFVLTLVERLNEEEGLDIRYDQVVLHIGDSLIRAISREIGEGDFLIAVVSPNRWRRSVIGRRLCPLRVRNQDEQLAAVGRFRKVRAYVGSERPNIVTDQPVVGLEAFRAAPRFRRTNSSWTSAIRARNSSGLFAGVVGQLLQLANELVLIVGVAAHRCSPFLLPRWPFGWAPCPQSARKRLEAASHRQAAGVRKTA
jgi:hypothetical protein